MTATTKNLNGYFKFRMLHINCLNKFLLNFITQKLYLQLQLENVECEEATKQVRDPKLNRTIKSEVFVNLQSQITKAKSRLVLRLTYFQLIFDKQLKNCQQLHIQWINIPKHLSLELQNQAHEQDLLMY